MPQKEILACRPIQLETAADLAGSATLAIVWDLDETVYNTVLLHWRRSNAAYRWAGYTDPLPTFEEVCQAGGTQHVYHKFLPEKARDYDEMNRLLRYSERANRNIPLITPEIPEIMQQIATLDLIASVLYLTTRPDELTQLSHEELIRIGMPDLPLLARPEKIPVTRTADWKVTQLTTLADLIPGHVVMVDDSSSLERKIRERNHPKVHSLLFDGPITPASMSGGDGRVDWNTLPDRLVALRDGFIQK